MEYVTRRHHLTTCAILYQPFSAGCESMSTGNLDADPVISEIPGTRDLYNIVWPNRHYSLQEVYTKARQRTHQMSSQIQNIFSLKCWTCLLTVHYADGRIESNSQQFQPCDESDLSKLLNLTISRVEYSIQDTFLQTKFGPGVYANLKHGRCNTVHVYESTPMKLI